MMNKILSQLAEVTHKLTRLALYISASGLFLMTLIIGWQVFARYVLNSSLAWSESAALLLMIYYIMLAAAVGVYEGFHLGLKILVDSVSPKVKRILEMFNNSLIIIFGIAMLTNGSKLAQFTNDHIIPTLNISRAFAYWPFAAAGLLITIFAFERILIIALLEED
jgi:TRAP-type C4-dicarboxylate transport system permease small subunit